MSNWDPPALGDIKLPEVILKPDVSDKAVNALVYTLYSLLPWSLWDQTAGTLAVLQQQLREANEASDRNAGEAVNAFSDLEELRARNAELKAALSDAIGRCEDMLMGDDGQAWSETRRMLPRLKAVLALGD